MRGLSSILSLFRNEFNKYNSAGALVLDSVYHMTLKILKKSHFWHENVMILSSFSQWTSLRYAPHFIAWRYIIYQYKMIQPLNCLFSENRIYELRFSDSVSLSFKTRLTSVTCFCGDGYII